MEKHLSQQGITYVAGMTGIDNVASKSLFHKLKFDESDVVWIDKNID